MRAAVVEDGKVVNVIVVDGEHPSWIICGDDVAIGWAYDGSEFTPPPEPEFVEP